MADRAGVWSRGGVPVEELPDPFEPVTLRPSEADDVEAPKEAAALADLSLFDCRRPAADADLADPDRAFVTRSGAARRSRAPAAVGRWSCDRPARRDQGGAGRSRQAQSADPRGVRRHRRSPLLPPLGDRSAGHRQGHARQPSRRRRAPGRKHDHPAARQDQFPVGRSDHQAQGAGGDHCLLAGSLADQAGNPLALSVKRLFRRRGLWAARRRPPLFQARSREPQPRPIGHARRHGPGAVAPRADPQSRAGAKAQPAGASRHGGHRRDQRGPRDWVSAWRGPWGRLRKSRPAPISPIG